jgi:hypothetical protein
MEIKPTYITFEQAKWLKEKGFNEVTTTWMQRGDGISGDVEGKRDYWNSKGSIYTSLPEQWQVVEWLRVNHRVWITVKRDTQYNRFYWSIQKPIPSLYEISDSSFTFNSPQEAYSAAFDFIKDNDLTYVANPYEEQQKWREILK